MPSCLWIDTVRLTENHVVAPAQPNWCILNNAQSQTSYYYDLLPSAGNFEVALRRPQTADYDGDLNFQHFQIVVNH